MMKDWLSARTAASPHALALLHAKKRWSYAELNNEVEAISGQLSKQVKPGQHIGTLLPNTPFTVMLIHALARVGAIMVPLNIRLTRRELRWQIEQANCDLVIYSKETADLADKISIDKALLVDSETMLAANKPIEMESISNFDLNNLQAIIHTSGTTGQPKGAMLTFANHFWSATASAYRLGVNPNDRWLSCLPLYHVGGLAVIFRSCLYGTTIVLHDRFDVAKISQSLDKDQITIISLVPTMLHRLLDYRQERPWPTSLRHVLLGGAAASSDLIRRCQEQKIPLSLTYGLTEAASQVATSLPAQTFSKPGSAGKPLLFSSVEVVDEKGSALPAGQSGEIVVSGPTVMAGYYNDPHSTIAALRDGCLFTGDIGYLDEDGDLFVLQRRSDMILCGGENIYPSEIEQLLRQHPGVADICVVGIPDEEWGQRVAAMIQRKENHSLTVGEMIDYCRQNLAGYKIPRIIKIVDRLPQTASGKIQRQEVAEALRLVNSQLVN